MAQWAEEAIILPNGPFVGERYRHYRHPVSRLFFDAVDSGQWSRVASTGPTQNGKTLMCYVIPTLYHLFEFGETVIVGLPTMDMSNDKWSEDFLPVIEASEYRDLLPLKGEGSRGGMVKRSIKFRNGATLRFMTAGGNDKKRAGFTSRVLAVTETDGMDESSETSREADKIEQLEGRTRAFGRTGKRIYLECTVSIERGRIWQEVKNGTDSRIVRPCPHCNAWVAPEREHLAGWREAQSSEEASDNAFFACPDCGEGWTEEDRTEAAKLAKLIHKGQEIAPDGTITGTPERTQTLGFRWSAIDNPFVTAGDLGAEEWLAAKSVDPENAEKKMRQFIWVTPYEATEVELTPLSAEAVTSRRGSTKRGILPPGCIGIGVGVDTGKRALHWVAMAVCADGSITIIEYGVQKVDADSMGVYRGLVKAYGELKQYLESGWQGMRPAQVWIDSGYHEHTDAVYAFSLEASEGHKRGTERYRPSKGHGEGRSGGQRLTRYLAPAAKSNEILYIGREYHIARPKRNGKVIPGVQLVHINSDHWKSAFHQALVMEPGTEGAITLYESADAFEHSEFASHVTAEKQIEKFFPARGTVITWERIRRENHKFDASYQATAACDFIRANVAKQNKPSGRISAQELAAAAAAAASGGRK
jgi:phage terminase large subunit GpA-like protein